MQATTFDGRGTPISGGATCDHPKPTLRAIDPSEAGRRSARAHAHARVNIIKIITKLKILQITKTLKPKNAKATNNQKNEKTVV